MRARTGIALCACGWRGHLGCVEPCGSCGRPPADRVTPEQLSDLRRIATDSAAPVVPRRRIRLIEMGLIAPAGDRHAVRTAAQAPPRVTDAGRRVLEVAFAAEHTRHDVAASVARHDDLERGW